MEVRLLLVANEIRFDELGRVSAERLLLDVVHPVYPAAVEKLDLLCAWTRNADEPDQSAFFLSVEMGGAESERERIPLDFKGRSECFQGISLDGFQITHAGNVVFRLFDGGRECAQWVIRAYRGGLASSDVAEA